jgi:hypothetical protein
MAGRIMASLQFGVFDEFKGARTLLLWGDESGIAALQAAFRELADEACGVMALHETGWAKGIRGTRLFLDLARSYSGEPVKLSKVDGAPDIKWNGTRDEFACCADLIEPLLNPSKPSGHQYLDSNQNFVLKIMVSRGEYPVDLR